MKRFLITLLLCSVLLLLNQTALAQNQGDLDESGTGSGGSTRYATCDLCGFCVNGQDPSAWPTPLPNWGQCRSCLYENASEDPFSGDTLRVDEINNTPPTPIPGRHQTVFGCIKTDLEDFTQAGAASSFIQVLLNVIFATAGGVAMLYIIYSSYIIMTSQADPERLLYGKRLFTGAIVGLILVLSSVFIVNFIANGVLRLPGFEQTTE